MSTTDQSKLTLICTKSVCTTANQLLLIRDSSAALAFAWLFVNGEGEDHELPRFVADLLVDRLRSIDRLQQMRRLVSISVTMRVKGPETPSIAPKTVYPDPDGTPSSLVTLPLRCGAGAICSERICGSERPGQATGLLLVSKPRTGAPHKCIIHYEKGGYGRAAASATEPRTPTLQRATIAQKRRRMEGWRQRRLGPTAKNPTK
jgi:hypothetical protein